MFAVTFSLHPSATKSVQFYPLSLNETLYRSSASFHSLVLHFDGYVEVSGFTLWPKNKREEGLLCQPSYQINKFQTRLYDSKWI